MVVGNELKKLKEEFPDLDFDNIEVSRDYKRAWNDGIRMFPALKIDDDVLSGFILTPGKVRVFIKKHLEE